MEKPVIECPFLIIGPGNYGREINPETGEAVFYVPYKTIFKQTPEGPKSKGTIFYQCAIAEDPGRNALIAILPGNRFPIRLN